jgi:hypothetical protein
MYKKLLAVYPNAADVYLGAGMANYFIGSLPRTRSFSSASPESTATRHTGIQQFGIAAEHGHYLWPFAKILPALAALG